MTTTTAHVTQALIDVGTCRSCDKCPVALAIYELVEPGHTVQVTPIMILLYKNNIEVWSCDTPIIVARFIHKFDRFFTVSPISFPLEGIPPELLRRKKRGT